MIMDSVHSGAAAAHGALGSASRRPPLLHRRVTNTRASSSSRRRGGCARGHGLCYAPSTAAVLEDEVLHNDIDFLSSSSNTNDNENMERFRSDAAVLLDLECIIVCARPRRVDLTGSWRFSWRTRGVRRASSRRS